MIIGDNDLNSRDGQGNLIALAEDQFDLDGYQFGGIFNDIVLDQFDPGEARWDTQDQKNPFGTDTIFGRDYLHGPTWTWNGYTNKASIQGAMNALEELSSVWWNEALKEQPGELQILRYNIGGVTRRVYGRARRCVYDHNMKTYSGTAPITMTFDLASNHYYDDEARSVEVGIVPNTTGGLKSPLKAPLTAVQMGEGRGGGIDEVGGTAPAPFHLYIAGPVIRPYVKQDDVYSPTTGKLLRKGWKIQIDAELVEGQVAHVSTYPGNLAIEDNKGAHLPLSPDSRLVKARLYPGSTAVSFGGSDNTGNAKATIVWRPAHTSL